ncbi:MAG TPA: hypothetical protein VGO09_00730 [Flavisolibacter sp.]|nr:hypothetical protein [Flavisolibacter sp.]
MIKKIIVNRYIILALFILSLRPTLSANLSVTASTPYEPLTANELTTAVTAVKKLPQYSNDMLFSLVKLVEQPKTDDTSSSISQWKRQASLTLFNPKKNTVYEVEW